MFNKKLEKLANESLLLSGIRSNYSNKDLANACLVLLEVLSNKVFDRYKKENTSIKRMLFEAGKMGKELRQFFIKYTGIDLHKAVKE